MSTALLETEVGANLLGRSEVLFFKHVKIKISLNKFPYLKPNFTLTSWLCSIVVCVLLWLNNLSSFLRFGSSQVFQEGGGIHFPEHRNMSAPSFHIAAEINKFIIFLFHICPTDLTERTVTYYSCTGVNFVGIHACSLKLQILWTLRYNQG